MVTVLCRAGKFNPLRPVNYPYDSLPHSTGSPGYGNTYHSVRIIRHKDNKVLYCPFTYGYGEQYQQTALDTMLENGWLPKKYNKKNIWYYERENNYPVYWDVVEGLKRDCVSNGK